MTCRLYNQRLRKGFGTEDMLKALKFIEPETKQPKDREILGRHGAPLHATG